MIKYIQSVFDSISPASFGRHACAIVLIWVMISAWAVMYNDIINKRDLFIPDVPAQWVIIILGLIGGAFGKEVAQSYIAKKVEPTPPPPAEAQPQQGV